jgi:hypothetical protein
VDARDVRGVKTPLFLAIKSGHEPAVRLLIGTHTAPRPTTAVQSDIKPSHATLPQALAILTDSRRTPSNPADNRHFARGHAPCTLAMEKPSLQITNILLIFKLLGMPIAFSSDYMYLYILLDTDTRAPLASLPQPWSRSGGITSKLWLVLPQEE